MAPMCAGIESGASQAALRALAFALVLSVGLVIVFPAARAADRPSRTFRIDAQPVSSALRLFAEQAHVQLIYSEQDVRDFESAGVVGELAPRTALERMLRGTGLAFEFTAGNVAVVHRPRTAIHEGSAISAAVGPNRPPALRAIAEEDGTPRVEEVTVTGSRILRRDLEAMSPIFTVEARDFDETSTLGVESVLNRLPQFVPTETQYETNDIFPTATNTPGIASLNLRGLSTNRTLVLIDGRRAQPVNATLIIDLNSIPSTAISSVEVITGGASATYGADAMGGVTNFKLREHFDGAAFEARSGFTEAGDGSESRVSSIFGANLNDDRGNVMLALEWTKRSAARLFGRPFFEDALTDPGARTTSVRLDYTSYEPNSSAGGLPSQTAANVLFPERATGTNVNRASSFFVNHDGTLFKDAGALGYTGELGQKFRLQPSGILGENNLDELVSSPLNRYSILARGHYAIAHGIRAFAQANFASIKVRSVAQPAGANGGFAASIPRDAEHPVPAELAALLDSRGPNVLSTNEFDPETGQPIVLTGAAANWRLGRPLDFLPPRQLENTSTVYQLLAGFDGQLPVKDWTWEAYVTHGQSETDNAYVGFASLQRYRAVVTAPFYGRGFSQTGEGQTRLSCTSGLPIFTQFAVTQDCIDAITTNLADRTRLTQDVLELNAQGAVMDWQAGEIRAALGATYRKNESEFRPDALRETSSIVDVPIGTFGNARVRGRTAVKEGYAELLLPLVRDKPFIDSLELELGARYSHYDTAAGDVPTYKALFSLAPVRSVRFRGGYQLANRAPNINELFLSPSSVPVLLRGPDPCRADTRDTNGNHPANPRRAEVQALCSAIIGTGTSTFDESLDTFIGDGRTDGGEIENRSGNPNVESERGRTLTFGVVFKSPFEHALARNLSVAIDWYRATVTGAIAQVGAQTTYDLCFNRDGVSNPTYDIDDPNGMCRRIVRDEVTGDRQRVNSIYANLGSLETSGVDLQASWTVTPAELGLRRVPGSVSLDVSFNKLLEFGSQSFPTSEVRENAGTLARFGLFSYRALTTLRYATSQASVALEWRRLPSVRNANYVTDPLTPFAGAESYSVFDLAAGWSATRRIRLTLGIDNLLDRDPNRVGAGPGDNGAGTTFPGFYDVLGRRYYASIRVGF